MKHQRECIDKKMALHYYGRVLFVKELAEVLKKSAETEKVRILSVLSGGISKPYDKLDDLGLIHNYTLKNAADAAGFYNDLTIYGYIVQRICCQQL